MGRQTTGSVSKDRRCFKSVLKSVNGTRSDIDTATCRGYVLLTRRPTYAEPYSSAMITASSTTARLLGRGGTGRLYPC
eukprot:759041-Hanusia_phi.AAC.3